MKKLALMLHTIDEGLPIAKKVHYAEIDIKAVSAMTKREFLIFTALEAGKFWEMLARHTVAR